MALGNYNDVKHSKWFRGKPGRWRKVASSIQVVRVGDTGEAKPQPYRAIVCAGVKPATGTSGRDYPRLAASRCGESRGKTPTLAIRGAFKDLGRNFK